MKRMLALLLVVIMVLLLPACQNAENDKPKTPETPEEILAAADAYYFARIPMKQYTKNARITDEGYVSAITDATVSYFCRSEFEGVSDLGDTVAVADGMNIVLRKTKLKDLTDHGFAADEKSADDENKQLTYQDKTLSLALSLNKKKPENSIVKEVSLLTSKDSVDFEYAGLKKGDDLDAVLRCLGYPSARSDIRYTDSDDACSIVLGYSDDYHSRPDRMIEATLYLLYDPQTDTARLDGIRLYSY